MYITSNLKAVNQCLHSIQGYDAYIQLYNLTVYPSYYVDVIGHF